MLASVGRREPTSPTSRGCLSRASSQSSSTTALIENGRRTLQPASCLRRDSTDPDLLRKMVGNLDGDQSPKLRAVEQLRMRSSNGMGTPVANGSSPRSPMLSMGLSYPEDNSRLTAMKAKQRLLHNLERGVDLDDFGSTSTATGGNSRPSSPQVPEARTNTKCLLKALQKGGSRNEDPEDWDSTCSRPHSRYEELTVSSLVRQPSKPDVLPRTPDSQANTGLRARRQMRLPNLQPLNNSSKSSQGTRRIQRLEADKKIFDLYYWNEVIQETGSGGKVVVCSAKVSGESSPLLRPSGLGTHVMKIKSKEDLRKNAAEETFRKAHLKMLNLPPHMGVLPLYEVLEDDAFYYVVMEKANGGSLLGNLVEEYQDGIMPERAVRRLVKEILRAIEHIHNEGMLHRDIKVDNFVVHVDDQDASPGSKIRGVKLIDFDIADPDWIPNSPKKKFREWVGTLENSAPETFRGVFSQQSDLYSVGTVLYLLMSGRPPYDEDLFSLDLEVDYLEVAFERLASYAIDWNLSCWKQHTVCRDFCKWLLDFDLARRPANVEEALKHPWFTGGCRSKN